MRYGNTGTTTRLPASTSSKVAPLSIWSLLFVVDDERTIQVLRNRTSMRARKNNGHLTRQDGVARLDRGGMSEARRRAARGRLLLFPRSAIITMLQIAWLLCNVNEIMVPQEKYPSILAFHSCNHALVVSSSVSILLAPVHVNQMQCWDAGCTAKYYDPNCPCMAITQCSNP